MYGNLYFPFLGLYSLAYIKSPLVLVIDSLSYTNTQVFLHKVKKKKLIKLNLARFGLYNFIFVLVNKMTTWSRFHYGIFKR